MTTRIAIRFEDDTAKEIREYAEIFGVSLNWLVNRAVEHWIDHEARFDVPKGTKVPGHRYTIRAEDLSVPYDPTPSFLSVEELEELKCKHPDVEKLQTGLHKCKACGAIKGKDGEWRS